MKNYNKNKDYLPDINTKIPGPNSISLAKESTLYEPASITRFNKFIPVFRKESFRANVIDVDDNLFVDFTSSFGVSFLGYNKPSISQKISSQSQKLLHSMGDVSPNKMRVKLAKKISKFFKFIKNPQVLFGNSGSESIEIALKVAHLYTQKKGIVSFLGNYHGQTLGALNVTGHIAIRDPFMGLIGTKTFYFEYPNISNPNSNYLKILKKINILIKKNKGTTHEIGCIVIEAIQNPFGYIIPPKEFLKKLSTIAKNNKILIVADEIFTGFGRTGLDFAFQHFEIEPDIICVGKILGGGLPISACITSEKIFQSFETDSFLPLHGSTFAGNPITTSSALEALNIIESEGINKIVNQKGRYLYHELLKLKQRYSVIWDIRGKGLLYAIEITDEQSYKRPNSEKTIEIINSMLEKGIFLLWTGIPRCNVIGIAPPYTISKNQIDFMIKELDNIFNNI